MAKRQCRDVRKESAETPIIDAFASRISLKKVVRTSRKIPELQYCAYVLSFVIFNVCTKCFFRDPLRGS
jgi:hypothetical protein